jgi:hypothetical protein
MDRPAIDPLADVPTRPGRRERWEAALAIALAIFGLVPVVGVLLSSLTRPPCRSGETECSYAGRVWNIAAIYPWSIASDGDMVRFELRKPDPQIEPGASTGDAQVAAIGAQDVMPFERDIWLSFDMMVEPGPAVTSDWLLLGQIWQTPRPRHAGRPAAWSQTFDRDGVFRILLRSGAGVTEDAFPPGIAVFTDPHFQRGRWYRFIYRLRHNQAGGAVDAWRDGTPVAQYRGPLGYAGSGPPQLQLGIIRSAADTRFAARFAHVRFSQHACRSAVGLPRLRGGAVVAQDCDGIAP